ncbi:hypothetical protein FKB34_15860 [Glycocaulis profundi]|nr:hypothetical protein FKB34_15860 [Glycocaulis profundi]
MFNKATAITVALGAAMMAAPSALALPLGPPGAYTASGELDLFQTQQIACNVTVSFNIDAAGNATVTGASFAPGNALCGTVVNPSSGWEISGEDTNPDLLSLVVGASSIAGTCEGEVVVPYNSTTGVITFNNATVPGDVTPGFHPAVTRVLG